METNVLPTTAPGFPADVQITMKYKDIPLNITEVGLHLYETWETMSRLGNMKGPYLQDTKFNISAIETTTQKMVMEMQAMDWAK